MKAVVPEIAWHNKSPVFTVDIQLTVNNGFYRAATGGGDSHVVVWHLFWNEGTNDITTSFAADLDRHIKAVNVVRFSKNGQLLASGDDDAIIIIWTLKAGQVNANSSFTNEDGNKENWVSLKTLRGHKDDIYDICWSPFSNELLSGSVDNTAIIWNIDKGSNTGTLGEHNGFIQGVAWDPKGKCLATLSSDRSLRVFDADSRKLVSKVTKAKINKVTGQDTEGEDNYIRLFHDDTVKTFFRRLNFSPDGNLIFVPCGVYRDGENEAKPPNDVSYVFLKTKPERPVLHLPSPDEYTIAVKCCPILFELNPTQSNVFELPYRIIFAVASRRSIVFYDTQQTAPFAFVTDIHYATLTDISWSYDGRLLLASSSDGYCTIVTFAEGELGVPYEALTTSTDAFDDLGLKLLDVTCQKSPEPTKNNSAGDIESALVEKCSDKIEDSPAKAESPEISIVAFTERKENNIESEIKREPETNVSGTSSSVPVQSPVTTMTEEDSTEGMEKNVETTNLDNPDDNAMDVTETEEPAAMPETVNEEESKMVTSNNCPSET
ncbi:hypothetical protein RUM43_006031 [Polyplax serrata]|uniref:CAF1B/HIR1 beta-propeller domain-containing protein n=1 Tax=Polyplax serrata TaxID=468196 RepID=A0AAN8NX55_POLSC